MMIPAHRRRDHAPQRVQFGADEAKSSVRGSARSRWRKTLAEPAP
jgi:hypothetical protein